MTTPGKLLVPGVGELACEISEPSRRGRASSRSRSAARRPHRGTISRSAVCLQGATAGNIGLWIDLFERVKHFCASGVLAKELENQPCSLPPRSPGIPSLRTDAMSSFHPSEFPKRRPLLTMTKPRTYRDPIERPPMRRRRRGRHRRRSPTARRYHVCRPPPRRAMPAIETTSACGPVPCPGMSTRTGTRVDLARARLGSANRRVRSWCRATGRAPEHPGPQPSRVRPPTRPR